jgi:polysaccharide biosynthesis transport protein
VDSARVPTSPAKPDIPRNMALALVIGLGLGVGTVFVLENMDNTVRTAEEAQFISTLPTLGVVPLSKNKPIGARSPRKLLPISASNNPEDQIVALVSQNRPKAEISEAYRALRTSILLSSPEKPPQVLMISSALPQEGKTTTSINVATVLAQRGARVLLIDADLRRPSVHSLLRLPNRTGLSTALTDLTEGSETAHILDSKIPNLWVLPSGSKHTQPAELLGSTRMGDLVAHYRQQYDHVVIDTPPVLTVTDAVLLSVLSDAVLLVVRAGQTTKLALRRTREVLSRANANIIGMVLNGMDLHDPENYHYYYYGKRGYYGGGGYYDSDAHSAGAGRG